MTLVLVFCLAAAPAECQEIRIPGSSLSDCRSGNQDAAAAWVGEHPKWVFKGWRCEDERRRQVPS